METLVVSREIELVYLSVAHLVLSDDSHDRIFMKLVISDMRTSCSLTAGQQMRLLVSV